MLGYYWLADFIYIFIQTGLSTTLAPTPLPFSQSIISHDNLVIDCNSPQAKVTLYYCQHNKLFYHMALWCRIYTVITA
jgi:hypothetical protein